MYVIQEGKEERIVDDINYLKECIRGFKLGTKIRHEDGKDILQVQVTKRGLQIMAFTPEIKNSNVEERFSWPERNFIE